MRPSRVRLCALATMACVAVPSLAFAGESSSSPVNSEPAVEKAPRDREPRSKNRSLTSWTATGGVAFGSWIGIPVTRASLGLDLTKDVGLLHVGGAFRLEPGQTESGLGAHRVEGGAGLSLGPSWLEVGVSLHLAYAMMVRVTKDTPFARALVGDIGGFGIGTNAKVLAAIPVGSIALVFTVRAAVDLYNGGVGYQVGPTGGLRF